MKFKAYRPKITFEKKGLELFAVFLNVVLFALGGLILARWTLIFFVSAPLELPPKLEQTISTQLISVLAAHWFTPVSGQIAMATPRINFKLVGIYASTNSKPGFAVFKQADGKQLAVLINHEINSGIILQDIQPEAVVVEQQGNRQKLLLENRKLISPRV